MHQSHVLRSPLAMPVVVVGRHCLIKHALFRVQSSNYNLTLDITAIHILRSM